MRGLCCVFISSRISGWQL